MVMTTNTWTVPLNGGAGAGTGESNAANMHSLRFRAYCWCCSLHVIEFHVAIVPVVLASGGHCKALALDKVMIHPAIEMIRCMAPWPELSCNVRLHPTTCSQQAGTCLNAFVCPQNALASTPGEMLAEEGTSAGCAGVVAVIGGDTA